MSGPQSVKRRGRALMLALGTIVVLGALGYLLYGGLDRNLVYFLTPAELLERGDRAYDVPVRLGGQVAAGSVEWNAEALDLRFRLSDGRTEIPVHAKGAPPQMFRDGMGVIVEGRYNRDGTFQSTSLMVKHSNEYRAPHDGEKPPVTFPSLQRQSGT
ncbi:cytochrome c maturation protein CcmE [soil metagenome]